MLIKENLYTLKKTRHGGYSIYDRIYTEYEFVYKNNVLPLKLLNKDLAEDVLVLLNSAAYCGKHDRQLELDQNDNSITPTQILVNKPYSLELYQGVEDNSYAYTLLYEGDSIRHIKPFKLQTINKIVASLNNAYETAFNLGMENHLLYTPSVTPTL